MDTSRAPLSSRREDELRRILIATDDEPLRHALLQRFARHGLAGRSCATWGEVLARLADPRTTLLLVDGALPGLDPTVLRAVAAALPHHPAVATVGRHAPPLEAATDEALDPLLAASVAPVLDRNELELLGAFGLGDAPLVRMQELAAAPVPLRIEAERGIGKEWIARVLHRLRGAEGPFVVRSASEAPTVHDSEPGTLFLEHLEQHPREHVIAALQLAEASGWRVIAGSRLPPDPDREGHTWGTLRILPLRARPKDIRRLVEHYLRTWRNRLGIPRRRIAAALWARLERHPWPGNHREVEAFVVQAATNATGPTLSPDTLPRRVLALLEQEAITPADALSFEQVVEERLRPFVLRSEPGPDGGNLHRLVLDATERTLLRLVLARTGGNQKAAAELLGIARNTLRSRIDKLGDG